MAKKFKTNALRMLDKAKIAYSIKEYEYDEDHLDGRHVASQVDMVPEAIFKTLVLHDNHNEYLVCCVPVLEEIDLKKLAKLAGRKNVEMIHQKDLLPVTGYMRGGCSPVGMKKQFPTIIQEDAQKLDHMHVSGGKLGMQLTLLPEDLRRAANASFADVIRREI